MTESRVTADILHTSIPDMSSETQKNNRTVTVSFRLPKSMVEELLEESERGGSSPSTTLRQVLGKHLNWDRYRLQMNMISFPDCFVSESLNRLSRKDIRDIASRSANSFYGLTLLKMKRTDLESTLTMMEEWFRDGSVKYRRGHTDGYHLFVIQHNLDVNWSLYLMNFFSAVCGNLKDVHHKVELSQDGKTLLLFARDVHDRAESQASIHKSPFL